MISTARRWLLSCSFRSLPFLLSALTIAAAPPAPVRAQAVTPIPSSAAPSTGAAHTPANAETLAPDSPRVSFRTFRQAARDGRWQDAARYVPLRPANPARSAELAQRLSLIIDTIYLLDADALSAESRGRLDDGLPPDMEEIGEVWVVTPKEPIRMMRTSDARGPFWAFAPATVARIDAWYAELPTRWLRDDLTAAGLAGLLEDGPLDILWWQWIALPFVALLATGLGFAFHIVGRAVMGRITARTPIVWDTRIVEGLGPPLTLIVSIIVFAIGLILMQVPKSGLDRLAPLLRMGTSFAVVWALWRLTSVIIDWAQTRRWATQSAAVRSLLAVGYNLARAVLVAFGALAVLASFGYPVSTVLAGLGLGGLALAFGAQKTVENLFGSIALAIDQPFRVGDWVKVDDLSGSVEDIGVRSTRLRTADRTIVTIPNGKLADQRVESITARDRLRIVTLIGLTYGTTRAQLVNVLHGIEQLLRADPRLAHAEEPMVAFKQFGASSLDIEVTGWFHVAPGRDYDQCRQDLLLGIMDIVEREGSGFAFPTRTVHLVRETASIPGTA